MEMNGRNLEQLLVRQDRESDTSINLSLMPAQPTGHQKAQTSGNMLAIETREKCTHKAISTTDASSMQHQLFFLTMQEKARARAHPVRR